MNGKRSKSNAILKRTKIVCTLGPATDDEKILTGMINGGMNVARINLSHGTRAERLVRMNLVGSIAEKLSEHIAIMIDTRGPDVRVGEIENGETKLESGSEIVLTGEKIIGTSQKISVDYAELPSLLKPGDYVYLNDGLIELNVLKANSREAVCKVVAGGSLKSRKGVNIPGIDLPMPILKDEDIADLEVNADRGFDYIAASFVRTPKDIVEIRKTLGSASIPIIAKIECRSGVENMDAIISEADGIMVARGDLGIEIPAEEVPGVQKRLIKKCRHSRKPVITATEMLESMVRMPRPTRAEIADVANAVLDGTSAVMLSQETAIGAYPVEAVSIMARVCKMAEGDLEFKDDEFVPVKMISPVREGIVHAACDLANDIGAPVIICVTDSGATAAIFSHYRSSQPVLACTPDDHVARMLCMYWGVIPIIVDRQESVEALLARAIEKGKSIGIVKAGQTIVFTGNLSGRGGSTNLLASVEVG